MENMGSSGIIDLLFPGLASIVVELASLVMFLAESRYLFIRNTGIFGHKGLKYTACYYYNLWEYGNQVACNENWASIYHMSCNISRNKIGNKTTPPPNQWWTRAKIKTRFFPII